MNQFGYSYGNVPYMPDAQASSGVEAGAVVGIFMGIMMAFYFIMIAMGIVFYILQSLGIYTVAKRRGIRKPWLAWIPMGDAWIMGSISDQYQYVKMGKITNRRKVLLILYIVLLAAVALLVGSTVGATVHAMLSNDGVVALGVGGLLLSYFAIIGLSIAMAVMEYIALYDIFRSCNPDNSVVFLILGIFIPVTLPFFLFFNRKKDDGMPPRKQPVIEVLPEETCEEAPAEEIVEIPVEEVPAEIIETPVEEASAEEIVETPVEETPTEE